MIVATKFKANGHKFQVLLFCYW